MLEIKGDIWNYWDYKHHPETFICITTNGFVKKNGECVMGRGVALQAKQRVPKLAEILGGAIKANGNIVRRLPKNLIAFPVKHNWWEKADIELIRQSSMDLASLIAYNLEERFDNVRVILPRPGCSNGKLDWKDVKPVISKILPDNVFVITNEETD